MIREEDLILQPADDGLAVIRMHYFLGREYRYCLQIPSGRLLYARTPTQTVLPVGTRVNLSVVEPFKFFPQE